MQQHELDREAFTETYCELKARIDRMISEDRRARVISSAESQKPRATHDYGSCLARKIKFPTVEIPKFGGQITEFKHFHDTVGLLVGHHMWLL